MATDPPDTIPLLAQVPVAELAPHLRSREPDGSVDPTVVRRRAGLSRTGKRMLSVLFLGLGIVSFLALARAAAAALSDGLSSDDAVLLAALGLISLVVASQALSILRTLPGTRRIWRWAARARLRGANQAAARPLLAQAETRSLLAHMPQTTRRTSRRSRPRSVAATAGWVGLTLVIMAVAITGAAMVALSSIRSISARGWGLGTLLSIGMTALIGYGVTMLSIGLIRSWFERRRRRLRRMLMRLVRYLLRGFDRSVVTSQRMLGRFDRRTGLLGRGVLVTSGTAIVVLASLAIPVSAVGGDATNADGPGPTSTSTTTTVVDVANGEYQATPELVSAGSPLDSGPTNVSDTTTTAAETTTRLANTTTTFANTTTTFANTTTTVVNTTTTFANTTTTVANTTTTFANTTTTVVDTTTTSANTTTTTPMADTTGPKVGGVSDGPDPIFTSGTPPDTSLITATTSDPSGVATVTVFYRLGKGGFKVWGSMKPGSSSTTFGPFSTTGIYEYRIMATDTLGNANCKTPSSCPGGTVTVIIP